MGETLPGETDANLEGEIEAGEIGPDPEAILDAEAGEEDAEDEEETVDADERR